MYSPYRRISQSLALILMFTIPILNIYEIYAITGTFYAINFGGLGVADPAVILQAMFAVGELTIPLLTAALFPLFIAILFGRIWCGWLCPFLFIAEGVDWLRNRLGTNRWSWLFRPRIPVKSPLVANVTRYAFLMGGTAVAGAVAVPILNYVNAPGILSTEAMILIKERALSLEFVLIVLIVVLQLTVFPKMWCRLFCPTGSVISLFRSPFGIRVVSRARQTRGSCCRENVCTTVCPMGLEPYRDTGNLLCVNCGRCIDVCPAGNLKFRGFEFKRTVDDVRS